MASDPDRHRSLSKYRRGFSLQTFKTQKTLQKRKITPCGMRSKRLFYSSNGLISSRSINSHAGHAVMI